MIALISSSASFLCNQIDWVKQGRELLQGRLTQLFSTQTIEHHASHRRIVDHNHLTLLITANKTSFLLTFSYSMSPLSRSRGDIKVVTISISPMSRHKWSASERREYLRPKSD
jgi:hypothetical protein